MKKLLILSWSLCAVAAMSQQYPKSDAEAAQLFVRIFQKADTAALLALLPPPSIYRVTAPDETQNKSDSEIMAMAEPLRTDMITGFRTLLREAESLKIDRSKIKVHAHESMAVLNYPGFYGIRIYFTYGKKKGEFSIGAALIDDTWYIYGIDQWEGVFLGMTTGSK